MIFNLYYFILKLQLSISFKRAAGYSYQNEQFAEIITLVMLHSSVTSAPIPTYSEKAGVITSLFALVLYI